MKNQNQIATELMVGCPDESRADHQKIASAILRGDTIGKILDMPEMDAYPDTYNWIKNEGKK